jgi:hypothetical protein
MNKAMSSLVAVVVMTLCACGGGGQESSGENYKGGPTGEPAKVELNQDQMTIQTQEGGQIVIGGGEAVQVPESFPKDVLVYPGAKVQGTIVTGAVTQLTLETADGPSKVAEQYQARMKQDGWKEEASVKMGELTMLTYSKDKRNVTIHVTADDDKTQIMVSHSAEQQ